jgi:hypothetical protein
MAFESYDSRFGTQTKLQAAEAQINLAIRLLFQNEEPIGIHTLTMAGLGILKDLCKKKSAHAYQELVDRIVEGKEGAFWSHVYRGANFFKHADRDPEDVFEGIDEIAANDFSLFFCCAFFRDLEPKVSVEMRTFSNWFFLLHPYLYKDDYSLKHTAMREWEENTRFLTREEQLRVGRVMLEKAKQSLTS